MPPTVLAYAVPPACLYLKEAGCSREQHLEIPEKVFVCVRQWFAIIKRAGILSLSFILHLL